MSDGEIDFLQKIEEALHVQRSHDGEVDLAAPEEIQVLTSIAKDAMAECKGEIQKFQDCDDDTKNSSEWCSPDGDNTNALTARRNKMNGLLVQALDFIRKAESANNLQQDRVAKAREGVEASQQSPNITLEALSDKMESFQYAIGTSTLKLTDEKAAVVQMSLGLLDRMKQISLNLDASASAARDEVQKLFDGDWHMSVESTLRECFKQLAEQAKYVQDRTTAAHNMDGFEAAKVKHFDQTELVQSRQNIATEFVKNAIVSLINVRSYLSKAKEMLVERCDKYKDTIFKRHTAILIQKEKMLRDLYSWYHTNEYEPAEMDLVFANGELAQAKTNQKLYCFSSNQRCNTARAALKAKQIELRASEDRVTTATEARDAVLNDAGYDDVRKELEKRGVQLCYRGSPVDCLEAHATEVQPDNVKKVKGMYDGMIAALGGILSLY